MSKLKLDGLKLSEELALIRYNRRIDEQPDKSLYRFCAEHKINIVFTSERITHTRCYTNCCIDKKNSRLVGNWIEMGADSDNDIHAYPSVGLLSVFPHKSSFMVAGRLLAALGANQIPIYGMSTAISVLTVIVDYANQDAAVEALKDHVSLPSHHSPFRV